MFVCNHGVSFYSEEAKAKLAAKWALAVDKLSVTFTAEHGGGYPPCLERLSPQARLVRLRGMGFRVLRTWEIDDRVGQDEPPELVPWATLSGGICVNLSDGWVSAEVKA